VDRQANDGDHHEERGTHLSATPVLIHPETLSTVANIANVRAFIHPKRREPKMTVKSKRGEARGKKPASEQQDQPRRSTPKDAGAAEQRDRQTGEKMWKLHAPEAASAAEGVAKLPQVGVGFTADRHL
jgi:hypothetical protein